MQQTWASYTVFVGRQCYQRGIVQRSYHNKVRCSKLVRYKQLQNALLSILL